MAIPTAPLETVDRLAVMVHEIVAIQTPEPFGGVGGWYQEFSQTTDDEVIELLQRARLDAETPPA